MYWIAIDFGTSRTKLAYIARKGARAELMRFGGEHDRPYTPSLFYIPAVGDILFGDAAEDMLTDDPAGVLDAVKRQLRSPKVRTNRRAVAPLELVRLMLAELRQQAGEEIAVFGGTPPDGVMLTVPAMYGPAEAELMEVAARAVGFSEVSVVPEPVAAARAWLAETEERTDQVVVLDCGGGTVDWAYVQREDERFRLVPACPPGGVEGLGGHDVDAALLLQLREHLGDDSAVDADLERRRPWILGQLRMLKERVGRGLAPRPIRVAGCSVTLDAGTVTAAAHERFVTWTVSRFGAYLEQVRSVAGEAMPPVLLVGGSAGLPELAARVDELGVKVAGWDRGDYAPVLGALVGDKSGSGDVRKSSGLSRPGASSARVWQPGTVFRDIEAAWCPEMVVVPAGEFVRGSPPEEEERDANEGPQRRVRVASLFALGRYAVTFAEFDEFVIDAGYVHQPAAPWGRGRMPVVDVSWEDAQAYCRWLSRKTGQAYRLPSEAEWEYACRAGTSTPFSFGATISTEEANYDGNYSYGSGKKGAYRKRTVLVDEFRPNAFGLQQMHGNVWEWCEDAGHESYVGAPSDGMAWTAGGDQSARVLRGGSWFDYPWLCRSAWRVRNAPDIRSNFCGFRVARTLTA